MNRIRKFFNNIFSKRAVSVLGPVLYARYFARFVVNIPGILRTGDLRPLDKSMGNLAGKFRYRDAIFNFDCRYCDEHVKEDSFAFGVVREIYIRDCYFKWLPSRVYERARIVLDLGANRGAFASLMTTRADFIVAVECQEKYAAVIRHNMSVNSYTRYAVETRFVGAGGAFAGYGSNHVSIDNLLRQHGIEKVDLLKMDIEGSEFSLFGSEGWLERINAITMEIHPSQGDPIVIISAMRRHGFSCVLADENLRPVEDVKLVNYIYAWKNSLSQCAG